MNARVMIVNLASIAAILSLVAGLVAALMAFTGRIELDTYKTAFDAASLVWFISSPLWFVPKLFGEGFAEAGRHAWLRPRGEQ